MSTILVNLDQLVDNSVVANVDIQTTIDARDQVVAIKDEVVALDAAITVTAAEGLNALNVKTAEKVVELEGVRDSAIVGIDARIPVHKIELNNYTAIKEAELQAVVDTASREVAKLDNMDVVATTLSTDLDATGSYEYDELSDTSILRLGIPRGDLGLTPQIKLTVDADGNIYSEVVGAIESGPLMEWSTGTVIPG